MVAANGAAQSTGMEKEKQIPSVGPPWFVTEISPSSRKLSEQRWLLPKVRDYPRHTWLPLPHPQGVQLTPSIVPDAVVGELHGVRVLRLLKVLVGVAADVAPAADVPADQTDPQVLQHKGSSGGQLWGAAAP